MILLLREVVMPRDNDIPYAHLYLFFLTCCTAFLQRAVIKVGI